MKRCPKCGLMQGDDVTTCDCGQSLTLTATEAQRRVASAAAATTPKPNTSTSVHAMATPRPAAVPYSNGATNVTLTAIDIPFWELLTFMFKLTFAALPAVFAATLVWGLLLGLLSALFGGSLLALLLR